MRDYAELPESLSGRVSDEKLSELWDGLIQELANPELLHRKHYSRRTYDAGCSGPLCRKAVREYGRRRQNMEASSGFVAIDEILTYWYPIVDEMVQAAKREALSNLASRL